MRVIAIGLVFGLVFAPCWAFAQTAPPGQAGPPPGEAGPPPGASSTPPPAAPTPPPGAITRDRFVQNRAEAAGRLFDQIDTSHAGYITRAQLRTWMAQHHRRPAAGGPPADQQ
jgi:hypothetical protein